MILATGSRVKSLPGLEVDGKRIVTSDDILKSDTLPKDIVVVGSGAVGVEFASMYHDLGTKVTVLEYLPSIVPLEDSDVSQALERSFSRRGITVMTNARFDAAKVEVTKDGVCLEVGPEGKEPAGAPGRDDARRDRSGARTSRRSGSRRRRPRSRRASSRSTAGCGRASRISTRSATSSAG